MSYSSTQESTAYLLEQKIKQIPPFDLSYETSSSHRKSTSDPNQIGFFIPKSKKYLVWFTFLGDRDVAILLELSREKKPVQYKIMEGILFDPDGPDLAIGSLLYGSIYSKSENKIVFVIEDVLIYQCISLRKLCFAERSGMLYRIFSKGLIQTSFSGPANAQFAFTVPVSFDGSRDPTPEEFERVPYPVHHIQYRLFDRIVPYVNIVLQSRAGAAIHRASFPNTVASAATILTSKTSCLLHRVPIRGNREPVRHLKGKERDVFLVRADIQSDMYILTHPRGLYEPDYAYIPNYRVSVFMNSLFRNIKENRNLDAIEESDDDEELMDTRVDKHVYLNREYKMECIYHKKFLRWIPLRVLGN